MLNSKLLKIFCDDVNNDWNLELNVVAEDAEAWNNGKEVPRWGVAEIQKMSPSTTGRCYCCH